MQTIARQTQPVNHLAQIARVLRMNIVAAAHQYSLPHLGSCLSCVDMLVALYWNVMNIDPQASDQFERDRFILSKGHGAPALFQVLAMKGFFPASLLSSFGQDGSLLGEHPLAHGVPGIEAATGSLGHGLSLGAGLALGSRLLGLKNQIYVLMSDGECNEGSVWEAALFAAAQQLSNLVVLIDFNKWQATGRSVEVMALSPLQDKWQAFGWEAVEVDGHDIAEMTLSLTERRQPDKPFMLIAHPVKGKGVSFMEDDNNWHYRIPSQEECQAAKHELAPMTQEE